MRKLLTIIFILTMVLTLTSCDIYSTGSTSSNSDKITVVNNDKEVTLNITTNNSLATSTEEAVSKIYSQVVVINATSQTAISSGSGVIIAEGEDYTYIATCCHVVDGFETYTVTLSNGVTYEAYLQGADPITDLAVLFIEEKDLNIATMVNDASSIKIGSECIVIGNPLGTLGNSVTKGIISSTSRSIKTSDGTYHRLLQTDAAINSGNSGGGIFNNQGELIGIVSAKYSATGVEGLGFAIPIDTTRLVVTELIEKGYVEGRTSLGITFTDGYYRRGFSYTRIVYVSYVDPDGSAYNKMPTNAIIDKVEFVKDGKTTKLESFSTAEEIENFLNEADLKIGDTINFTIRRSTRSTDEEVISITLQQYQYNG